jgi:hypothetical protein
VATPAWLRALSALDPETAATVEEAITRARASPRIGPPDGYHRSQMMSLDRSWTPEERAREERVTAIRSREDQAKRPEQRLEETLRLSRLVAELQQDAARDVPTG